MAQTLNLATKANHLANCVVGSDSFCYAHTKTGFHEKFITTATLFQGFCKDQRLQGDRS
ncbi:hypothetical protein [Campylobacter concisus]|uniref:Uncharacterized protein n=1 Tax=Campylobacter concisus (strain 13826) TaxID=360104 RepID=A0A0M4TKJ9_CAMC1|nr:hypothetical protein [Campylobacter concisus]ALF45182.1 hypothetical protein CCC13826_1340 [Campylobacter concisus 13826]